MSQHITVVIGSLDVGGTETQLATILPQLKKEGFCIQLVVLDNLGSLAACFQKEGISVTAFFTEDQKRKYQKWGWLGRFIRVLSVLKKLRSFFYKTTGLIHFFLPEATLLGLLAAKSIRFKGPLVFSRRSLNAYQKRRPLLHILETYLLPYATAATGNSLAVIEQLTQEGIEHPYLIYNGIDIKRFINAQPPEKIRQRWGIPEKALLIVKVANLHGYKGHADLLKIFSQLPFSAYLMCVGKDAGMGSRLSHIAVDLGLSKHVLWVGHQEDVPSILNACDISVLCSHEEGFSNAILESMAAGLPVVATDVGGNKEAICHGKTGYIASNPEDFLKALIELGNDPLKRQQMGAAGKQRIQDHFSMDLCVKNSKELYQQLFSLHALWKKQCVE